MLSVNPDLTQRQVADIIESTARKISFYPTNVMWSNGWWNNQIGYGVLDAYRAVLNASLTTSLPHTITGPSFATVNTQVTYSIPTALPAGMTFTGWTVNINAYTTTSGLNNRTLNIKFTTQATCTLTANFILSDGTSFRNSKVVQIANYFSNQILYSNTSIFNGYALETYNITVKSGATLTLQAPEVIINEPFVVEAGAGLVLTH